MAVTDPADARLIAALAEVGKVAVHELAARIGMDPREAAYRLVALSGSGLPLLVGVESDPQGLRTALAGQPVPYPPPGQAGYPPHGVPSGPVPAAGYPGVRPARPHPGPVAGFPGPQVPPGRAGSPGDGYRHGVPSGRHPVAGAPPAPAPLDPVISTWGPPQTASWARGDQRPAPGSRTGRIGDRLAGQGLDGEQLTVQLLEVQDPADYLFGAAGYRLEPGERAIVVHTEVTNTGPVPFVSLPDNYLELLTADGAPVTKAPVSLTSRPPHKIGVASGETAGGHTVYVVPESTRVISVRWSPRPEPDDRTLTWSLED